MSKLEQLIAEFCPNGVEYKKLSEVCTIKGRVGWQGLTRREYRSSGNFLLVTGTDFTSHNKIDFEHCVYVDEERYIQDTNIQLKRDDILITKDGTLGKMAIINELPLPATLNGGIFVIRSIDGGLLPRFILHYMLSSHFRDLIDRNHTGSTIQHLTQNLLVSFPIPVPPLPVQSEIVRILDNFTELTAELTAEHTARKKQYEYYLEKMANNPSWAEITVLDMLSQPITDGPHETPNFVEQGVPFISAEAIYDSKIDLNKKRGYITKEYDDICAKKYKPQKGDVYMVKSGSTTGKVAMVNFHDDFNIWSPIAAMRVNSSNNSRFLYHLLKSKSIQTQVKKKASHGSQPNLGMRELEKFVVHVPSLEEQNRIVEILDRFDSLCNDITTGLPAEIEARTKQYEYYRDKLLTFKELS